MDKLKSLKISREMKLFAKQFGFSINYKPNLLKTFRNTYSHLLLKSKKNTKIILLSNYRGNFRSPDEKYTLDGRVKNSGVSLMHMFLPHLAFEKNIYLVVPPIDKEWINYLKKAGVYKKNFDVKERLITVNLPKMNASPVEALMKSDIIKKISKSSLLITTFNDLLTKKLVNEKKLIHNQAGINSYDGNSKINQRNDFLPMPPSIVIKNQKGTIEAVKIFRKTGIKKIWIKCGNNMGAGQFMKSILIDSSKGLARVLKWVQKIHNEQRVLMGKKKTNSEKYDSAEFMLEADMGNFGKIVLEGSIYFIMRSSKEISILHYARQVKDPKDNSKAIGGRSFKPEPNSLEALYPKLMQQLALFAGIRQRKRNYEGFTSVDIFILEMTKENFQKYLSTLKDVGMPTNSIPFQVLGKKIYVGILGEINERESVAPPVQRIALNLGYRDYLSTTLINLPKGFDFTDLKRLVLESGLKLSQVIPLTRKPSGLDKDGAPIYKGISGNFYLGIFANNNLEVCYQRLIKGLKN
ncbi:MAG: hypothetical protein ABIE43_01720 [Patescibacteria group bacterium]